MSRNILQKNISRLMAVLLTLSLLCALALPVLADGESGSCGGGLSWSLSAGTLTITGSGEMDNFPESDMAPWYSLRTQILRVSLPEGLTSIGNLAFYGCENLTAVAVPNSVTRIGSYAFAGCEELQILTLGSGVQTIGDSAFSDCVSLTEVKLPGNVKTLGDKAFYRCERISTITVPASVTSIGMSCFGYCKSLVSADIQARIDVVPEWMFYGCPKLSSVSLPASVEEVSQFAFRDCSSLSVVYYGGTAKTPQQIQQQIGAGLPEFVGGGAVLDNTIGDQNTGSTVTDNADGTITQESTTVSKGENSTVSSTVTVTRPAEETTGGDYKVEINVNVDGGSGWQDAKDQVENDLKDINSQISNGGGTSGGVHVNVFVKGDTVDQAFVDSLIDRGVSITITTQDGSAWTIEPAVQVAPQEVPEAVGYDLRYEVTAGSQELCQEIGVSSCYVLRFLAPAQVNAKVMIRLGEALVHQSATLIQRDGKELDQIQTVVVDMDGFACFYLGSVDNETEYFIAMNLPGPEQPPIVPDSMLSAYGNPEQLAPVTYEITGRTSSWGMNISQVTWIMVGVLGGAVVIVGIVMFALNKRKLKHGYVPDWDDDDE